MIPDVSQFPGNGGPTDPDVHHSRFRWRPVRFRYFDSGIQHRKTAKAGSFLLKKKPKPLHYMLNLI